MSQRTPAAKGNSQRSVKDANRRPHARGSRANGEPSRATVAARVARSAAATAADVPRVPAPSTNESPLVNDDQPSARGRQEATALARVLRAVADEVERDATLAARVGSAWRGEDAPARSHSPADASGPAKTPDRKGQPNTPTARRQAAHQEGGSASGRNGAPTRVRDRRETHPSDAHPSDVHASDMTVGNVDGSLRVGRSFRPRILTGAPPDLGPGVPDPFALRARLGDDGLRAALDALRLGTLRAMIREHHLDPDGRLRGVNDAARLRAAILAVRR